MNRATVSRTSGVPRGFTAVGVFLLFGTAAACLAGITLSWPGTSLDRVWRLNPRAYKQLAPLGWVTGVPFLLLACGLAVAALGWFKRQLWGWRLTVFLMAAQFLADVVNVFSGHSVEGVIGVAIAGALLLYLLRREVKNFFEADQPA